MTMTADLLDYHLLRPNAVAIPVMLRPAPNPESQRADDNHEFGSILAEAANAAHPENRQLRANLSAGARAYLSSLNFNTPDADLESASQLWFHALAIGFAPAYLAENGDGVRQNWPRIPLPESRDHFVASVNLGRRLAGLLDLATPCDGVDRGKVIAELSKIAVVSRNDDGAVDLHVTAGWGHAGNEGVTMPGKGKLERRELKQPSTLGQFTYDVYLNDNTCWSNIPERVWDYTMGGYQVIKKWLSYREHELLGRPLTLQEARSVTTIARRIAAVVLAEPELDENYRRAKSRTVRWEHLAAKKSR